MDSNERIETIQWVIEKSGLSPDEMLDLISAIAKGVSPSEWPLPLEEESQ